MGNRVVSCAAMEVTGAAVRLDALVWTELFRDVNDVNVVCFAVENEIEASPAELVVE